MKKVLALILAIVSVLSILSFAGCGTPKTDMEKIKKEGKIIVGITDYPPMNYKVDGKWVGFDTELTEAFAKKLGVEVEFVEINWDNKFIDLQAGTIDCVWNGMTITDEARKSADISDVYLKNSQVVVLPASKADSVKSIEDLKGMKFAVEKGSAGKSAAEDNGFEFTEVDVMTKALLEVQSGTSDACVIDKTLAEATVGKGSYTDLAISLTLSEEEFGVAFRQGSDLTAEFNAFLKEYKESGEFDKLAAKYDVKVEK